MRRSLRLATSALIGLVALGATTPAVASPRAGDAPPPLRVTQDKASATAAIGGGISLTSTVSNPAPQPARHLVAHLNVLSLDPAVYVDPEDWSSHRTQYLDEIPAHGRAQLAWTVHAVNAGQFIIYTAVTGYAGGEVVTAGPAVRADVTQQKTIDAAGVLPVAITVPLVLLALLLLSRLRRRHLL